MFNEDVIYRQKGTTAWLTLNRPRAMNSISLSIIEAMEQLLPQIAADDSVRVVVLTGAGSAFVKVTFGGHSAAVTVEVAAAVVVGLSVLPTSLMMEIASSSQLLVLATYSDGQVAIVTNGAAYQSNAATVASVTYAEPRTGGRLLT